MRRRPPAAAVGQRRLASLSAAARAAIVLAVVAGGAAAAFGVASARDGVRSPAAQARPRKAPPYRYLFDSSSGARTVAANGWNLIDVDSKARADRLPAGTRALLWVGDYDNTTCSWQLSDSALKAIVSATANDPKVGGYFFSDEPDPNACPNAPAQHRARSHLIDSLAPSKFTVLVIDSNSGHTTLAQIPLWKGTSDYQGLNPYPCYPGRPCDYNWIAQVIHAGDAAGLHYWGVVQAFHDSDWRWPTPAEERHMLAQWAASHESGYMTFAWTWHGNSLATKPSLLSVFKSFNRTGKAAVRATRAAAPKAPAKPASTAPAKRADTGTATELHYTYTGAGSVAFDWSGTVRTLRYGLTANYGKTVQGRSPGISPYSSKGPFWQAQIRGLKPGTTYQYSLGSIQSTFTTAPIGAFRFDFEADVGASGDFVQVMPSQDQIAADKPAFVIVAGDLTYANDNGQSAVDRHFKNVMVWSRSAAYMPAWGNHEWDESTDDLRNYKGRFQIPHPHRSPGAPVRGCCGSDWGWFDAGPVRFISYPEPYTDATWSDWRVKAGAVMAAAQQDPRIHFIVTFGHRPAYSTGYHQGEPQLASILNGFGDRFSKYVLNLNGHSHDYERFVPIHHVVHITAGGGGASLEPWSSAKGARTVFRALHLEHLRVDVTSSRIRIDAVCGPPSEEATMTCKQGSVIDSYTVNAPGTK